MVVIQENTVIMQDNTVVVIQEKTVYMFMQENIIQDNNNTGEYSTSNTWEFSN